jgi:acetylornithine deacetylase/succinyl-diaminopimelate desuccinylase family protein
MIDASVRRDVTAAVDSLKDELVWLVSSMVQIPSLNPTQPGVIREEVLGGETRVNEFLKPVMESIGLETDLWEAEEGRANLVGICKGSGGGRSLLFNGHVDVVIPGPEELWTEASPWSGKVAKGRIYGRGACDMKGGNGAVIIAVKALLQQGYRPKGDVIIQSVVGEEMMNTEAGTGAAIERGYRADAGIVVEPSNPPCPLAILTASPGVLIMTVRVKGKAAHTCMRDELVRAGGRGAEVAVSAVDKAFIIYQGLAKLEEEWGQTKSHPAFTRPGHFTICPATFRGGTSIATIPDECVIEYVVWHAPQDSPEKVKEEIEDQVARYAQTDAWLRENPPKVEWWDFWWPPFDIPADSPICYAVATAYEAALGKPAVFYGFSAVDDASFLNQAGIPTISMGPGDIRVAHAANEYVDIQELVDAAKVYALSIVEWCGI